MTEYIKETAKQRKARERAEPKVLVGFGSHSLIDLYADRESADGEDRLLYAVDKYHWPPVYRRVSLCSAEEVTMFQTYLGWVSEMMGFLAPPVEENKGE